MFCGWFLYPTYWRLLFESYLKLDSTDVPIYPTCFHVTNHDYPTHGNCVFRINIRTSIDNEPKLVNRLMSVMKRQCVPT